MKTVMNFLHGLLMISVVLSVLMLVITYRNSRKQIADNNQATMTALKDLKSADQKYVAKCINNYWYVINSGIQSPLTKEDNGLIPCN